MWVVKLGGSLLGSPELPRWLDMLVKISDGKVIIVPGGSVFADAVREAQQRTGVDDTVAHHLALLAMDQFGLLLTGINSRLVTASSELELAERGWQHRAIVWLPSKMVLADDVISKNWQVTSDSLSAWLAKKIGAERLLLVKSKPLSAYANSTSVLLQTLVNDTLVDEAFGDYCLAQHFQTYVVHKANYDAVEPILSKRRMDDQSVATENVLLIHH
ncbi:uridylate kinase [Methylotenera sp. L2L1]|uniref:amino acid kinase family protein n=1 Tax=Methylotenera sp. L2L1 TaxID=1502770 RepID=UPI00056A335E|nr:uridylate kinase [Methylotenera sp. L2L1]